MWCGATVHFEKPLPLLKVTVVIVFFEELGVDVHRGSDTTIKTSPNSNPNSTIIEMYLIP